MVLADGLTNTKYGLSSGLFLVAAAELIASSPFDSVSSISWVMISGFDGSRFDAHHCVAWHRFAR